MGQFALVRDSHADGIKSVSPVCCANALGDLLSFSSRVRRLTEELQIEWGPKMDIPTFRGLADKMVTIRQECAANAFKRDVKKK